MSAAHPADATPPARIVRPDSDADLMRRIQADDGEALGELYRRHAPACRRLARSICHDSSHAEEAVQEAFISIWSSRSTFRPQGGGVRSWALTITRNRAIDLNRRHAKHDRNRAGDQILHRHAGSDDVPTDVIATDTASRLTLLLDKLPDAQREVIQLAFYSGLSHSEIATRLGMPAGTVKGRMRLGLQALRLHFGG